MWPCRVIFKAGLVCVTERARSQDRFYKNSYCAVYLGMSNYFFINRIKFCLPYVRGKQILNLRRFYEKRKKDLLPIIPFWKERPSLWLNPSACSYTFVFTQKNQKTKLKRVWGVTFFYWHLPIPLLTRLFYSFFWKLLFVSSSSFKSRNCSRHFLPLLLHVLTFDCQFLFFAPV